MATESVRPERVIAASESFLKLAAEFGETTAAERVRGALERCRLGLVRLVIAGEARTGKSSFINAVLGESELLPTSNDVTTSTVFKIVYGENRRYRVFFLPRDPAKPDDVETPKDIEASELADYGTEDGNPDNGKYVDFIAVELPNPLLKQGLVIIDTPGLGGLFKQHALITWRYLPNADALIFVLESVTKLITVEEIDALDRIRELTKDVYFVQTKIDSVDEAVWQQWRDRNLSIISEHLKLPAQSIRYLPVSNELKRIADREHSAQDLEWSGFQPVLNLTSNLIQEMRERYASALLNGTVRELGDIRRRSVEEQQVFAATSAERLNALERQFREARDRFDVWQRDEYPAAKSEFEYRFKKIGMEAMHRVQTELDGSPHGGIVSPLVNDLRARQVPAEKIFNASGEISGRVNDRCGRHFHEIQMEFDAAFRLLIEDVTGRIGKMKTVTFGTGTDVVVFQGSSTGLRIIEDRRTLWDKVRHVIMGKGIGASIGVAIAGVVAAPLAAAFMLLGGLGGGLLNLKNQQHHDREQALSQLSQLLSETIRAAQASARQHFERMSNECGRLASESLRESAQEVQDELRQKFEAVKEARARGQAENAERATAIQRKIDKVDIVLRQAAACLPARAAAE